MDQSQKNILYLLALIGSFFIGTTFSSFLEKPYPLVFKIESHATSFFFPYYNLNKVTEEELCSLPNIGPSTAKKIVTYQQKYFFKTIDELKKVPTIGAKKFNKIKKFFFVKKISY